MPEEGEPTEACSVILECRSLGSSTEDGRRPGQGGRGLPIHTCVCSATSDGSARPLATYVTSYVTGSKLMQSGGADLSPASSGSTQQGNPQTKGASPAHVP